jgi:tRNA wybutosine-synthesizing protein 3
MNLVDTSFPGYKKRNLEKLSEALEKQHVDADVITILHLINADERFVTTSSCAGRIVVLEVPELGDKKQAIFHGRWHDVPLFSEVQDALKSYGNGQLWFLAQPPIFHIATKDLASANLLLQAGVEAGFKHSGIKTIQKHCIVELLSTERLDMPIGSDGTMYYDENNLRFLFNTAEKVIKRAKIKLTRLETTLQSYSKNRENNDGDPSD